MKQIQSFFWALYKAWGPQHWWPAETAFEVVVGAYLTQNTAWTNVEKALTNLRSAGKLSVESVRRASIEELEQLIRPAGYFRQKSARLKTFIAFLDSKFKGSLDRMFAQTTSSLRSELLTLKGVGPETADSILLYAGNHEIFVVDAYTRRVFERHGLVSEMATYEEIRAVVEKALNCELPEISTATLREDRPICHSPSAMSSAHRSRLAQHYNEFHGLIVQLGKHYCLKTDPRCETCPLGRFPRKQGGL